jgi:magnesium chelatase family protein
MALAVLYSRASVGISAPLVTVETHISGGLPGFTIVGLPETAVKESKDRVRSALLNSKFDFPTSRITVNLAPADLPKEGGRFDLPIALGILAASKQIPMNALTDYEFAGELALSGELRAIHGTLPFALGTRKAKRALILPLFNAEEATLPGDNIVFAASHLLEVYGHLTKQSPLLAFTRKNRERFETKPSEFDLRDVKGQPHAKRALEIAAAGGHSLLMMGSPGTGKTMLAMRLPGIMPTLSNDEALEVAAIYSLVPSLNATYLWGQRPFRAPHHTASAVALVGGGSYPRPGEISLAHNGVLFLDELPEFDRQVLEVLREPLESGTILISRAARQAEFPARFQLIAAMNPCPCGYLSDPKGKCQCTAEQIRRYRSRISGPLLDRIDMHIEVPALPPELLSAKTEVDPEPSVVVRNRVKHAVTKQISRSRKLNAKLANREIHTHCVLDEASRLLMNKAMEKLRLSARSYHRILKVARTIADLSQSHAISSEHVMEALSFRRSIE